mgnify:CR=1 FL=1|tara:strand:- start:4200 stop:5264 length:1065 start_codon:yes stop_codon:yes gene_type:complete
MALYSGNVNGNTRTFVFSATGGTNANFVTTIGAGASTGDYVSAGGDTFGTTAEIRSFRGNVAYLNYKRNTTEVRTELLPSGGITFTEEDVIPDPRIVVGFLVGEGITGHHMDEIHYQSGAGNVEAFLGRLTYSSGSTLVPEGSALIELVAPGLTGVTTPNRDDPDPLKDIFTVAAGNTIENKTNGMVSSNTTGSTFTSTATFVRVPVPTYKNVILGQVRGSVESAGLDSNGLTGITIGDATHLRHVMVELGSKELNEFLNKSAHVRNNNAITGDSSRVGQIFTSTGISGTTISNKGILLNAVTGGTVAGTSVLQEFAAKVANAEFQLDLDERTTVEKILNQTSVRGIDQIPFTS